MADDDDGGVVLAHTTATAPFSDYEPNNRHQARGNDERRAVRRRADVGRGLVRASDAAAGAAGTIVMVAGETKRDAALGLDRGAPTEQRQGR